jgi:HlyD family secretion protein
MFTIANDLTKMQVQANIDEGDIGKIKVEQDVTFTVDAYPELTFSGTVRQVRLQPVVSQNVVNYTVIIDVPNEELKLLPGMTANITVLIDESRDVLKVPATALRFTPSQDVISEMIKSAPDSVKKMMERWTAGGRQRNSGGQPGSQGSTGNAGSPDNRLQGGSPVQGPGLAQRGGTPGNPEMKQRPKMGLVWIREGETIRPRRVRTGLSDGTFTEVEGRNLKEGDEVILGMASQQTNQASQIQQQQNPFAPPRPPSGRGGR